MTRVFPPVRSVKKNGDGPLSFQRAAGILREEAMNISYFGGATLGRRAARVRLGGPLDERLHFAIRHFEHGIVVGASCADVTPGPGLLAQVPGFSGIAPAQEDVYHLCQ